MCTPSSTTRSIPQPFSPATVPFTGIGVLFGASLIQYLIFLLCIRETFDTGGKRCYLELQNACRSLRAHTSFPSTSQLAHSNPTHARDDRVACENSCTSFTFFSADYTHGNASKCPGSGEKVARSARQSRRTLDVSGRERGAMRGGEDVA